MIAPPNKKPPRAVRPGTAEMELKQSYATTLSAPRYACQLLGHER
jgi:hypothetical protein